MNKLILVGMMLFLNGCDWGEFSGDTYDLPYIEDDYRNGTYIPGHEKMCDDYPDSVFCGDVHTDEGVQPTYDYAVDIVMTLRKNTKYVAEAEGEDHWKYTDTVWEYDGRDCEDEAMTMVHHMIYEDGIDPQYLYLVFQITSTTEAHLFVGIDTEDRGMMHMDVNTVLAPIEEKINGYMWLADAGVYNWNWEDGEIK